MPQHSEAYSACIVWLLVLIENFPVSNHVSFVFSFHFAVVNFIYSIYLETVIE